MRQKKAPLTKKEADQAITAMAIYLGLLYAWRFTCVALFASFICLVVTGYRIVTPLYMLALLLFLPLPFGEICGSIKKIKDADEKDDTLPFLKAKYKFSHKKTGGLAMTSLIMLLMFAAWHIGNNVAQVESVLACVLPYAMPAAWFVVALVTAVVYLILFNFFPLKLMK